MNEIKICEEERKKQLRVDLGMDLPVLIVKQLKKDTLLHLLILSISSPRKRYRIALKKSGLLLCNKCVKIWTIMYGTT